jgi:hypothetical protein
MARLGGLQHDAAEVGAEVSGAAGACWEDVADVEEAIKEVWEKKQRLQEEEARLQRSAAELHAALQVLQEYKALQEYSRLSKQAAYHSRQSTDGDKLDSDCEVHYVAKLQWISCFDFVKCKSFHGVTWRSNG